LVSELGIHNSHSEVNTVLPPTVASLQILQPVGQAVSQPVVYLPEANLPPFSSTQVRTSQAVTPPAVNY